MIRIAVLATKKNCSQRGSSITSTIQGQNSTTSLSLSNCALVDITWCVTPTQSATQRQSTNTPSCMQVTPGSTRTPWTDSTCRIVCSPPSSIASTPRPLRSLEILLTCNHHPAAYAIMPNLLPMWDTQRNQKQVQWEFQLQTLSIHWLVVSSSCSIHLICHSDLTHLVFAIGRLRKLYMWNIQQYMSLSDFEMVSFATQHFAIALAESSHWQIIETY
jgi:hypothetical protein